MKNKKIKVIRYIILVIAICIFIGLIVYLFPVMRNLSSYEGQVAFKEKVVNSGIYGYLMLLGLEVAKLFLVFLPGEPIEILAGMCYGAIGGTIFILSTVAFTTTVIFFAVRKYGKELIYASFSKEKVDKIENRKIFQNTKKIEYILEILFAVVGTPKDLITYVGSLLPIKPYKFILIATFCRIPSVISSTIVGQYFSEGNWKISLIIYAITFIFTAIVLVLVRLFDKDKTAEKAINELK